MDHLVLEPIEACHTQALWQGLDAHRDDLRQWLSWVDAVTSAAAMAAAVTDMVERRRHGHQWSWVIRRHGQVAGLVCLMPESDGRAGMEVTYWVLPVHRGHAVARRALGRVIDHARRVARPYAFLADVAEHNSASAHVLSLHGFQPGDWLVQTRQIGGVTRRMRRWWLPGA